MGLGLTTYMYDRGRGRGSWGGKKQGRILKYMRGGNGVGFLFSRSLSCYFLLGFLL